LSETEKNHAKNVRIVDLRVQNSNWDFPNTKTISDKSHATKENREIPVTVAGPSGRKLNPRPSIYEEYETG
jgi:hypothetical protein